MILYELMQIYQMKNPEKGLYGLFNDMFEMGELDRRLDRNLLGHLIFKQLGRDIPKWNSTEIFLQFGIAFFQSEKEHIQRNIDLLNESYNPLFDWDVTEEINRETDVELRKTGTVTQTPNLTDSTTYGKTVTRRPDLRTHTDDLNIAEGSSEHYVSADNEHSLSLRTQDKITGEGRGIDVDETGSETTEYSGTDTTTNTGSDTMENDLTDKTETHGKDKYVRQGRRVKAGELINDALDVNAINIYNQIIDWFQNDMLVTVW